MARATVQSDALLILYFHLARLDRTFTAFFYIPTTEEYTKLKHAVSDVRTTLSHSEKVSGKWNKDDKSKVTSLCNEKSDWLEKRAIKGTSVEDIQQQEEDFEQRMEPFLEKLAAAGV